MFIRGKAVWRSAALGSSVAEVRGVVPLRYLLAPVKIQFRYGFAALGSFLLLTRTTIAQILAFSVKIDARSLRLNGLFGLH